MDALSAGVGAFPLLLGEEGESLRVVGYGTGRDIERRLADLGLCVGSEVRIVSRDRAGRMVIACDDIRLALSTGVAHRVLVTRTETYSR